MRKQVLAFIMLLSIAAAGCAGNPAADSSSQASPVQERPVAASDDIVFLGQGAPLGDGNADGYYYLKQRGDASFNIKYVDYASASEVYLCSRPECTHDGEGCQSWRPYGGSMGSAIPIGNDLYTIFYGASNRLDAARYGELASFRIERSSLDGSGTKTIASLQANESLSGGLATDGAHLYLVADTVEKSGEEADFFSRVYSIDLSDGSIRTSEELRQAGIQIVGAARRKLILQSYDEAETLSESKMAYCLYDVDTGEIRLLGLHVPVSTNAKCCGEFLCWIDREKNALCKWNILTDEAELIPIQANLSGYEDVRVSYILPHYLCILLYEKNQPVQHGLLDLETASLHLLTLTIFCDEELPDASIRIFAEAGGEKFLVSQGVEYELVNFPAGDGVTPITTIVYKLALLPMESCLTNQGDFEPIRDSGV